MIFSHCDFTQDMEQAVVHLVVDFRKPHDFFSGSALQVSEKTAVFGVFTDLQSRSREKIIYFPAPCEPVFACETTA